MADFWAGTGQDRDHDGAIRARDYWDRPQGVLAQCPAGVDGLLGTDRMGGVLLQTVQSVSVTHQKCVSKSGGGC